MPDAELPLFPLNIVLFPEMLLPLHVFEPRYVAMIEDCLRGDRRFGVVLVSDETGSGSPESDEPDPGEGASAGQAIYRPVGTAAVIRESNRIPSGRYMLLAVGERRFRVESARLYRDHIVAEVHYFSDDPTTQDDIEPLHEEVRRLAFEHLRLIREATGRTGEDHLPDNPEALSLLLAGSLEMDLEDRQHWLESTDTRARLAAVGQVLEAQVAKLRRRSEIHEWVEERRRGNGKLSPDHLDENILKQFEE